MLLDDLEAVLQSRRDNLPNRDDLPSRDDPPTGSYTAELLADPERIQRKIMEEAFELCLELGRVEPSAERTAEEAGDLIYHLLVGLVSVGVPLSDVMSVLEERRR